MATSISIHSAADFESPHITAQLVVLPISIGNSNLVWAFAVAVDTDSTATGTPVKVSALLVGSFRAALALLAIPLAVLSGEDPGVGHWENRDEGEDGAGWDLHFESEEEYVETNFERPAYLREFEILVWWINLGGKVEGIYTFA